MPRDVFTHHADTTASVEDVWRALDEPGTWEAVGGVDRVSDPVVDSEGRLRGFSFEVVAGGRRYQGEATPLRRVDGEAMAWAVDTSEIRGSTSVELGRVDGGTRITVTLEVEPKGLLATMFFGVVASAIGSGLPRSVEEFAAGFEED